MHAVFLAEVVRIDPLSVVERHKRANNTLKQMICRICEVECVNSSKSIKKTYEKNIGILNDLNLLSILPFFYM